MGVLHMHQIAGQCSPDETCPAILDEPAEDTVILIGQVLPDHGPTDGPGRVAVRLPRNLFHSEVTDFLDAQRIDQPVDLTGPVDVAGPQLPSDELLQLAGRMSADETAIRIGRAPYEDLVQRLVGGAPDGAPC